MRNFITYAFTLMIFLSPASIMAVEVGEKAVDFAGVSTRGEIRLSDYQGKKPVVLALFFRAFTPV